MKVFVTGATGFVGSHLCRKLKTLGHDVYGLVRNDKKLQDEGLELISIKGSLNHSQSNDWIDELPTDLDCVIHVAGIVHSFNEDDFTKINKLATKQLINDLNKKYTQLNFIFISSLAAAGPGVKNEKMPLTPVSDYGRSKKDAESLLNETWSNTIIRPPMIIGPGDPAILDIYKMVKSKIILTAGANALHNRYSFVCVYDLVDAIIKAMNKRRSGVEDYFISHHRIITFEEIIDEISSCMGILPLYLPMPLGFLKMIANLLKWLPFDFRLTPDKINELAEPSWICENDKSIEKLKVTYEWDLKETIKITFDDYLKRKWI